MVTTIGEKPLKFLIMGGMLGRGGDTSKQPSKQTNKDTNLSSGVECWGGGQWLNKAPKPHIMGGMLEQGERTHGKSIAKKDCRNNLRNLLEQPRPQQQHQPKQPLVLIGVGIHQGVETPGKVSICRGRHPR